LRLRLDHFSHGIAYDFSRDTFNVHLRWFHFGIGAKGNVLYGPRESSKARTKVHIFLSQLSLSLSLSLSLVLSIDPSTENVTFFISLVHAHDPCSRSTLTIHARTIARVNSIIGFMVLTVSCDSIGSISHLCVPLGHVRPEIRSPFHDNLYHGRQDSKRGNALRSALR
jgi:hypothetical protein